MSEIKIFNTVKGFETIIDINDDNIIFHPKNYDNRPNFEIKIGASFDFFRHAKTCEDCAGFIKDLNSNTLDWRLTYKDVNHRLDMTLNYTRISTKISEFENGSVLHLYVSDIPLEIEKLNELKEKLVREERFEEASVIRDEIDNQL